MQVRHWSSRSQHVEALMEMAKQIGDRANSVRNAALNAMITETYLQVNLHQNS